MGPVALLCAIAFSLACLYQERRKTLDASPALWLSTIWMMRVASRAFGYWLPTAFLSWGDPVILTGLTIIGLVVLRKRESRQLLRDNRVFLLFFVYISLSILWTDDMLAFSKRWSRIVGDFTMALIVLTQPRPFSAALCVIRRAIIVLLPLSLVVCLFYPDQGTLDGIWIGVAIDKNWFGVLCAAATAFLLSNYAMRKRKPELAVDIKLAGVPFEIPYLLLSLYLLFGGGGGADSRSSTSIVLLGFALTLFLLIGFVRRHKIGLVPLFLVFVCALLSFQVLPRATGHRTLTDRIIEDVLRKNVSLTDRADFWPLLIQKGMLHPWLGAGFDSFFSDEMQSEIQRQLAASETYFKPNQAHNGYLELFLNLGLVGLLLFGMATWSALKGISKTMRDDFESGRLRLIILSCALLSNYTEASFARPNEFVWFLFLLAAINPSCPLAAVSSRSVSFHSARGRFEAKTAQAFQRLPPAKAWAESRRFRHRSRLSR
jgi:O-antigen ligase